MSSTKFGALIMVLIVAVWAIGGVWWALLAAALAAVGAAVGAVLDGRIDIVRYLGHRHERAEDDRATYERENR